MSIISIKTVSRLLLSIQVIIWLNHDVFLISLLFRIVSCLNHIDLPLFMLNNVNVIIIIYTVSRLLVSIQAYNNYG